MTKIKWLAMAFMLALLALLTGCSAQKTDKEDLEGQLLVGFSQLGSESTWRLGNTKSMFEAAEKYDVNLMYINANQSQENQKKALRSFIGYRVDVIAFAPIVEDGWDDVLKEAKDANIPVILVDRGIQTEDSTLYASHVGSDFYSEGMRAGQYLLKKADKMGSNRLNIVEITGTEGSTPMLERQRGFKDALGDDERFTIMETVCGDFIISKGKEVMRDLLEKYGKEIDVLFAQNDGMMRGALEAMEEAGFVPGKDIIVISVDGDQGAIDLLREGKINCVVECSPMLGDIVMDVAQKLANGENVEREYCSKETSFTEFDDLSRIAPRGY